MAVGRAKKAMAVGRYELVYELAPSYLGPLWAVHSESGDGTSHVALLRQVSLAGLDADTRVRLLEAAWQAMEIRHERIAPVADVVASDGELGIVSDYIEGQTLRALQGLASVRRAPMPVAVALRILLDIAEGIAAVHRAYLDFGDEAVSLYGGVSADSVLVGTNGRAYVTDVAVSSASTLIESLGNNPDRVAYEAPEQVSTPPTADARTDVFAIGILAWELLSNRRLFIGSDKAVTQKVLVAKIPRLDEVKRRGDFEIPDALLTGVMKALERDPSARFKSVDELLTTFRDAGVAPADDSVVGAYVQALAEGILERTRDALKDSSAGRLELGSRVQSKQPQQPSPSKAAAPAVPADLAATKPSIDKSLTDTVPIPGQPKRPAESPAAKAVGPAAPAVHGKKMVAHRPMPEGRWTEAGKPKPVAAAKPKPVAFEAKPRLPVPGEARPRPDHVEPKPKPAADARQGTRRATMLGVAPAAGLAQAAAAAAARKAAAIGVPPVTAQMPPPVVPSPPVATPEPATPFVHRPRQPTMIGIPPPAANSAPKPASISPKAQESKQVIFDSMPPPPPSAAAPPSAATPTPSAATPTSAAALPKTPEEEPTGQYDTHELLQQVEAMGKTRESARSADFPEPPTKPRIAIPAPTSAAPAPPPADGGWLDGPDDVVTERPPKAPEPSPSPPAFQADRRAPVLAPAAQPAPAGTTNVGPTQARDAQAQERGAPAKKDPVPPVAPATPSIAPARPAQAKAPVPSLPPPAHVLPSQIPPPLIHDPRANRAQTGRPDAAARPSRARSLVLPVFASIVIASASAAIGIVALGGRNPASVEPKTEAPTTPVVDPAPTATAEATALAPAQPPAPEAPPQPPAAAAPVETAPAAAAAPAPAPAPRAPTAATPGAGPQPAAKRPAPAPPQAVKKKKSSRYVPDDI